MVATLGLVLSAAFPAAAEWEVHRSGGRDLTERAARAFAERPGDLALARRLVELAGRARRAELRARFCAGADGPTARADVVLGCATLLLALGGEGASAMFDKAAALHPTVAAFEGRARALSREGHNDEARRSYEQALALARRPADERRLVEATLSLADAHVDPARQLVLVERLAALEPQNSMRVERVAELLEKLGRPADAAGALEAYLARATHVRDDERFAFALRASQLRDAAGDGERAAAALAELLARTPRGATERRRLVWERSVEVARRRQALPALAAELARAPGPVEWDVLARVRDELGDLEGALEAMRRATRGARPSPELGQRTIALLERLGRDAEVAATYEAFARAEPGDARWPLALVEHELRRGSRRRASEHLAAAIARFGRNASALEGFAALAARWGEDGRALELWERVSRLRPRDEHALQGLAEAQLASGRRDLAVRTWQRLRGSGRSGLAGRLRLVEALLEHDFVDEARAQLPPLEGALARSPRAQRLLAQILERQGRSDAAVDTWRTVLTLSGGAGQASERHEARARILALLARGHRAPLEAWLHVLASDVAKNPANRELAIFLSEAQQRAGDDAAAMATLRAILEADVTSAPPSARAAPDTESDETSTADVTFALARLLRSHGALPEAVRRLGEIALRFPARAREAHVLLADLGLARHDEVAALAHAEEAARLSPDDGEALARVAAIEERAGDDAAAAATYRRAFALDADGPAGFGLAHLLTRQGEAEAASGVLHRLLQTSTDEDVILEATRGAISVDEYLGRLPDLERIVAGVSFSGPRGPTLRRVRGDVLRRLVPSLYRTASKDSAADVTLAHLGKLAVAPLLGLVTEAGVAPDFQDIEVLGMLRDRDAVPVLARLAAPVTTPERENAPDSPAVPNENQLAAVVALGRLGDARAHDVVAELADAPEARLRATAVWALGRLARPDDATTLSRALRDARPDISALACLGLGRLRTSLAVALLLSTAEDAQRPSVVRRAALAGLALAGERRAAAPLLTLASSGDGELEAGALTALGALRDSRALPLLLDTALLGDAGAPATHAALAALATWSKAPQALDEAISIENDRIDVDLVLAALAPTASAAEVPWPAWTSEIVGVLDDALAAPGRRRDRALAVLDERDEGLSLGSLWTHATPTAAPEVAAALQTIAVTLRRRVGSLLDDGDAICRAHALRLLAKIGDGDVTAERIATAATGTAPLRQAALFCARIVALRSSSASTALALALTKAASRQAAPDWRARLALVETLAQLGAPALGALTQALSDPSPIVRAAARGALSSTAGGPRRP